MKVRRSGVEVTAKSGCWVAGAGFRFWLQTLWMFMDFPFGFPLNQPFTTYPDTKHARSSDFGHTATLRPRDLSTCVNFNGGTTSTVIGGRESAPK